MEEFARCAYCDKPVNLRGSEWLQRWVGTWLPRWAGTWLTYCSEACADRDKYGDEETDDA